MAETSDYLLLFRGKEWDEGLSDEELQRLMDKVIAWHNGLTESGVVKGGRPLARLGKAVSAKGGVVQDGPFAETKEAVGGYLMVRAASLDEATEMARGYPALHRGVTIEVRPLLDECPVFQRAKKRVSFAMA